MNITLQNLTKRFPARGRRAQGEVTAVEDLSFQIPDGMLVGLLGPSGCGKSTTLNMICGLETPTEGKIFFGEEDVTALAPELRGVGMVFQNYALYPHLTVLQNILFPLENLKGKDRPSREERKARALEAARLVQIEELLDRKPKELSGGDRENSEKDGDHHLVRHPRPGGGHEHLRPDCGDEGRGADAAGGAPGGVRRPPEPVRGEIPGHPAHQRV